MDSVVCLISVRQESKHYTHNITCLTAIGSDDPGLDPLLVPRKDFEFLTFTDRIEITTLAKHQGWDMEPFPNAFPTSLEGAMGQGGPNRRSADRRGETQRASTSRTRRAGRQRFQSQWTDT